MVEIRLRLTDLISRRFMFRMFMQVSAVDPPIVKFKGQTILAMK